MTRDSNSSNKNVTHLGMQRNRVNPMTMDSLDFFDHLVFQVHVNANVALARDALKQEDHVTNRDDS